MGLHATITEAQLLSNQTDKKERRRRNESRIPFPGAIQDNLARNEHNEENNYD